MKRNICQNYWIVSKIKKVRMLKNHKIIISMRRFESEGTFNVVRKYIIAEIYSLLKKDVTYKDLDYKFGKFNIEK